MSILQHLWRGKGFIKFYQGGKVCFFVRCFRRGPPVSSRGCGRMDLPMGAQVADEADLRRKGTGGGARGTRDKNSGRPGCSFLFGLPFLDLVSLALLGTTGKG